MLKGEDRHKTGREACYTGGMPSYNLMKPEDRARLRQDREDELQAAVSGRWPRDLNDRMRWSVPTPENAARQCQSDIDYLNQVDRRVAEGDPSLTGWE